MRRFGERGSTRHILLLALVGALVYGGLHWEVKVSCLFQDLSAGIPAGFSAVRYC
jgi:hypothetical protein